MVNLATKEIENKHVYLKQMCDDFYVSLTGGFRKGCVLPTIHGLQMIACNKVHTDKINEIISRQ